MAQEQQPKKNHISNLAAAIASFEPSFVNEKGEQEYRTRNQETEIITKHQLIGLCIGAIEQIYEFIQLHGRLKKEHSDYLSEHLACFVALGKSGLDNSDSNLFESVETLIGHFSQALDILENICKSPDGETQTIARKFVLRFRPNALDGQIIHLENFVRTEPIPQADSEPNSTPPQP